MFASQTIEKVPSLIWNLTYDCPWFCKFCCMDAGPKPSKQEMSLDEKLGIIDQIISCCRKVDVSGGDIMTDMENLQIIQALSESLGKDKVGVSLSGYKVDEKSAKFFSQYVNDVELTIDASPENETFPDRPNGYHKIAGKAIDVMNDEGITTGVQTIATRRHCENKHWIDELYQWLRKHNVHNWSILKFYPSGRGVFHSELELTTRQAEEVSGYIRELCKDNPIPKLDIHYLMPGTEKDRDCRCVKKSIGILPNGDVTSCFWGLNAIGKLCDEHHFLLGNIRETRLDVLLSGERAAYWRNYKGGCPLSDLIGKNNV